MFRNTTKSYSYEGSRVTLLVRPPSTSWMSHEQYCTAGIYDTAKLVRYFCPLPSVPSSSTTMMCLCPPLYGTSANAPLYALKGSSLARVVERSDPYLTMVVTPEGEHLNYVRT